jgi:hypothetical protein
MAETLSVTDMLPNKFEPKRKNHWYLAIEGLDAFLLKTAARPTISNSRVTIDWMNAKRYLAGKHEFDELTLTLHDPIAPSAAQQVTEWLRLCYESVSARSGYADFYKRDIQLKVTDPVGNVVELWDIKGAFPTSINFGDLTYENSDAQIIDVKISFDNCVLQY